jgi:hypothetical protein
MSCYISSNNNRFYTATEPDYGEVAAITADNRFPAVKLAVKQVKEHAQRKDKTGGRTFIGVPLGVRKKTTFELQTYLTGWSDPASQPGYGPLFQGAMGGTPMHHTGKIVDSLLSPARIKFTTAHALVTGQAVAFGGEIRFVAAIVDPQTVEVNAPFSIQPTAGSPTGPTLTYGLGDDLPSVSIFDYWSPVSAVQRIVAGSAIDKMSIKMNSDFHEFDFRGGAKDVLDSSSFITNEGELSQFPAEPAVTEFAYDVIPGHLGQIWLGNDPTRFYTVTAGEVLLNNNLDLRNAEFGSEGPQCISAGRREVLMDISLYEQANTATKILYQAARQRSPISAMIQLGQQPGQLFGMYLKSLVPEVPEFIDNETRLQWRFSNNQAQGTLNDELVVAFA